MNLPIDEMLSDLRAVLEAFDNAPTFINLDKVTKEITRIERVCDDSVFKWGEP